MRDIRYQAALVRGNHLLVVEVTLKDGKRFWLLPGGGREPVDGSAEACVVREVREETGLEVTVDRLLLDAPEHPEGWGYARLHTYLCRVEAGEAEAGAADGSARVSAVKWLDLGDETGWGDEILADRFLYPQLTQLRQLLSEADHRRH